MAEQSNERLFTAILGWVVGYVDTIGYVGLNGLFTAQFMRVKFRFVIERLVFPIVNQQTRKPPIFRSISLNEELKVATVICRRLSLSFDSFT